VTNPYLGVVEESFADLAVRIIRHECVQAAFGFLKTRPSAGTRIVPWCDRAGAVHAADAGIIPIVKRIVGQLAVANVLPYPLPRPIGQRIDFQNAKSGIPGNFAGVSALPRLIPADGGDPGAEGGEVPAEGIDFAQLAAQIGIAPP